MELKIIDNEEYIDIIKAYAKYRVDKNDASKFMLASERALDTIAICGIREKPSKGIFGEKRIYTAPNKEKICLYRPRIESEYITDCYQEITQNDLDVLRAVNTKYVEELIGFKFKKDINFIPYSKIEADIEAKSISSRDIVNLLKTGEAIAISTKEIKKRLHSNVMTSDIIYSFRKLSTFSIKGNYKVSENEGVKDIEISDRLFDFAIIKEKGTGNHIVCLMFNTLWGQAYLHNLKFGNISWIVDDKYIRLSNTSKNILFPVISFKRKLFIRREQDLLQIVNIKESKNKERAVRTLNKGLDELVSKGYIIYNKIKEVYYIENKIDATRIILNSNLNNEYASFDGDDADIIDIAKHYDMLARKYNNSTQYFSLSIKDPKGDPNWEYFEDLYYLCDEKGWNPKVYLEAQFNRAKKWENENIKYPLPHMLLSEAAQDWYPKYIKDIKEKYAISEKKQVKPAETFTAKEEIRNEILKSMKYLKQDLSYSASNKTNKLEPTYDKVRIISYKWESYSPYYLWSVKWFQQFLHECRKECATFSKAQKNFISKFDSIQHCNSTKQYIIECTEEFNKLYELPKDLSMEEIIEYSKGLA